MARFIHKRYENPKMVNSNELSQPKVKNEKVSLDCPFKRISIEFDDNKKIFIENDEINKYQLSCAFSRLPSDDTAPKPSTNAQKVTKKVDNMNELFLKLPSSDGESFQLTNRKIQPKIVNNCEKAPPSMNTPNNSVHFNKTIPLNIPGMKPLQNAKLLILPQPKPTQSSDKQIPNQGCNIKAKIQSHLQAKLPINPSNVGNKVLLNKYDMKTALQNVKIEKIDPDVQIIENPSDLLSKTKLLNSKPIAILKSTPDQKSTNNTSISAIPINLINDDSFLQSSTSDISNMSLFFDKNESDIINTYYQPTPAKRQKLNLKYFGEDPTPSKPITIAPKIKPLPNKPIPLKPNVINLIDSPQKETDKNNGKESSNKEKQEKESNNEKESIVEAEPTTKLNFNLSSKEPNSSEEIDIQDEPMGYKINLTEVPGAKIPAGLESNPIRLRAKKSPIWNWFVEETSWTLICSLCGKSLIYKNNATWPLKMHLKSLHNIDLIRERRNRPKQNSFIEKRPIIQKKKANDSNKPILLNEYSISVNDNKLDQNSSLKKIIGFNNNPISKDLSQFNIDIDADNIQNTTEHLELYSDSDSERYRKQPASDSEDMEEKEYYESDEDESKPKLSFNQIKHSNEDGIPLRSFCNLHQFWEFKPEHVVNDMVKFNDKLYVCGKNGLYGSISEDKKMHIPKSLCREDLLAMVYCQERKAAMAFSATQTVCLSCKGKSDAISHYYKFRSRSNFKTAVICMSKVYIQMNDGSIYYQKSMDNLKLLHRGAQKNTYLMVLRKPPRILIQADETQLYYGQNFLKNIDIPKIQTTLGCISKGCLLIGRHNEVYRYKLGDSNDSNSEAVGNKSVQNIGSLDPFNEIDGYENHLFIARNNFLECQKIGKDEIYPVHCRYEFADKIKKLHVDRYGKIYVLCGQSVWSLDIL